MTSSLSIKLIGSLIFIYIYIYIIYSCNIAYTSSIDRCMYISGNSSFIILDSIYFDYKIVLILSAICLTSFKVTTGSFFYLND